MSPAAISHSLVTETGDTVISNCHLYPSQIEGNVESPMEFAGIFYVTFSEWERCTDSCEETWRGLPT